MNYLHFTILLGLAHSFCSANAIGGPFLFWGKENVKTLQPNSLVEGDEIDFENLYKDAKGIIVFVRNATKTHLEADKFPQLQNLIRDHGFAYLPQRSLSVEPFNYNSNIELINLNRLEVSEDEDIVQGYNDAVTLYGEGDVLGILAYNNDGNSEHFISKRENKENEAISSTTQTPPPQTPDEVDESSVFIDSGKVVLYSNNAPLLYIPDISDQPIKLMKHVKCTFDINESKRYARMSIVFLVNNDKLFVRFKFTLAYGYWTLKEVEVERGFKIELPVAGHPYNFPSAPIGFSYRCGAEPLIFGNETHYLKLTDYQVQPYLNGSLRFGDVFDCVGFTSAPIWAGILITLFLCGILSIGLIALYDIKTPSKFETSRSKQLTFTVQE